MPLPSAAVRCFAEHMPHRHCPFLVAAVAAVVALVCGACGAGAASEPATSNVFAVDASASTNPRLDDIRAEVRHEIEGTIGPRALGRSAVELVTFAGGPMDTRSTSATHLLRCTQRRRSCAERQWRERVAREAVAALDGLLRSKSLVGGSDPIGFLFRELSELASASPAEHRLVVWTDLFSRSDTLDIAAGVDLSTPAARRTVVAGLAVRGLDFASLQLGAAVAVEVRLVPTDVSAASTIFGEQLKAFLTDLLRPIGARLTVTWMTSHAPA